MMDLAAVYIPMDAETGLLETHNPVPAVSALLVVSNLTSVGNFPVMGGPGFLLDSWPCVLGFLVTPLYLTIGALCLHPSLH